MRPFLSLARIPSTSLVLAMYSNAIAKDKADSKSPLTQAQSDCQLKAFTAYIEAGVALDQKQGVTPSTIESIMAKRRLLEGYCVQFVQCVNVTSIAMGAMFSSCLDDEDAERLKGRK